MPTGIAYVRDRFAAVQSWDLTGIDAPGGTVDPAVLMTAEDVLTDLGGRTFEVQRAGRVARLVADGHREDSEDTAWDCLVRVVRRD